MHREDLFIYFYLHIRAHQNITNIQPNICFSVVNGIKKIHIQQLKLMKVTKCVYYIFKFLIDLTFEIDAINSITSFDIIIY